MAHTSCYVKAASLSTANKIGISFLSFFARASTLIEYF